MKRKDSKEQPKEKKSRKLKINKQTVKDMNPKGAGEEVKGGAQRISIIITACGCQTQLCP